MRPPPRPIEQRKADALAKLAAPNGDVWVASAGDGPYLVPLSFAWMDGRIVLALEETSRTARNITATGSTRLGIGPTRDVVLIDATLDAAQAIHAAGDLAAAYAAQAGWDPREAGEGYLLLSLRPVRIQAWREANELTGRTLMRDGVWLV